MNAKVKKPAEAKEEKKPGFGLGQLINNLKTKIAMKLIQQWIAKFVEAFRAGNPKLWAVIVALATILQFGAETPVEEFLASFQAAVDLPTGFLSLDWILDAVNLEIADWITDALMWLVAFITSTKTTVWLSEKDRAKKIAKTEIKLEKMEATEAAH